MVCDWFSEKDLIIKSESQPCMSVLVEWVDGEVEIKELEGCLWLTLI